MDNIEGLYNPELKSAVRHLLGKGLITSDKDIADKMKYSKSTVSGYITGKVKASKNFINEFEKTFKLSLDSFKNGTSQVESKVVQITGQSGQHPDTRDLIASLKAQIAHLKKENERLEKDCEANSDLQNHHVIKSRGRLVTIFQQIAHIRSKLEKRPYIDILQELNTALAENLTEILKERTKV